MAFDTNGTKSTDLFVPEVVQDYIEQNYIENIIFAPLADINNTLQGRPGDTLTIPVFSYIGAAADVAEGADIPIKKLTSSETTVTVKKAANSVLYTDEAELYAFGNPEEEAAKQLTLSISDKIEDDFLSTLSTSIQAGMTVTASTAPLSSDTIIDGNALFGEKLGTGSVLFVSARQAGDLMKSESWISSTDMGVAVLMSGVIGMIGGSQVIISDRIVDTGATVTNYIIKPGALGLLVKTGVIVKRDSDSTNDSNLISARKYYATYLKDSSRAVKLTVKGYQAG